MALSSEAYVFKGTTNVYHDTYNSNLLYGLMGFLRWASVEAGGFQNITYNNASGILGGEYDRLRPVKHPDYTDGQVWEGFRGDWIWETGTSFSAPTPIVNSGVYVDDVWNETATSAHYVDFPNGRVVFDSAQVLTSEIRASFSHRIPTFVNASEHWLQELCFESYNVERSDYLTSGSGEWSQLNETRRMLPVIGLHVVNRRGYQPYQLGGNQWVDQAVDMYVVGEEQGVVDRWTDIIAGQNDRTLWLPSRKLMKDDAGFPHDLDYRGVPVASPMTYPQLIQPTGDNGFGWTNVIWQDTYSEKLRGLPTPLFTTRVNATFTAVLA